MIEGREHEFSNIINLVQFRQSLLLTMNSTASYVETINN